MPALLSTWILPNLCNMGQQDTKQLQQEPQPVATARQPAEDKQMQNLERKVTDELERAREEIKELTVELEGAREEIKAAKDLARAREEIKFLRHAERIATQRTFFQYAIDFGEFDLDFFIVRCFIVTFALFLSNKVRPTIVTIAVVIALYLSLTSPSILFSLINAMLLMFLDRLTESVLTKWMELSKSCVELSLLATGSVVLMRTQIRG